MIREHGAQRRHEGGVVLQWLAHAHHHDVGDHAVGHVAGQALGFSDGVFGEPKLGDDLARGQVAAKTLMPRRAKTAAYRAARLTGNAQRIAILLRNENSFNRVAMAHIKQPFDRAVAALLLGEHLERRDVRDALELIAQGFGQITHLRKIVRALLMNPAIQLLGAEGFFTQPFAKNGQPVEIEI